MAEEIRINKFLSDAGVCSRREADKYIEEGRVTVNGVPAEAGQKVTAADAVVFDGQRVSAKGPKRVVLAVNKPRGVVCTTAEFKGEKNIVDLVNYPERIYPVGRLDKTSEGLILMTNRGDLVNQVLKSSREHEKEYVVSVDKPVTEEMLDVFRNGVYLEDLQQTTKPCRCWISGEMVFHLVLTQGLNRQIRRMCEAQGLRVRRLKRVRIMGIQLGDIPLGGYRELTESEVAGLMNTETPKNGGGRKSTGISRADHRSRRVVKVRR